MKYRDYLKTKDITTIEMGFEPEIKISDILFPFQRDIVTWAIRRGKAALFADTGLGKTLMQLEWSRHIWNKTKGLILIVAPLAVSKQTQKEGLKLGLDITPCRKQGDCKDGINITNYEMLQHFEADKFSGIVLDESSILKSYSGKIRNTIIEMFGKTKYRLACTATPAPNDYMELGNHSEFLGTMTRVEMLAMFFVHDGGETQTWRLKGHAEDEYWRWLCSWAVTLKKPSDLGYENAGFDLPELVIKTHYVESNYIIDGNLFQMQALGLSESQKARRASINERIDLAARIANDSDTVLVWCEYNVESELLKKSINDVVEVKGSDSIQYKEDSILGFSDGSINKLVTKPSIAGFGVNWQQCNNVIFVGVSHSYEKYYQAVRRCWRFGQKRPVTVHVILSKAEESVLLNLKRKEMEAKIMSENMVKHMADITKKEFKNKFQKSHEYNESKKQGENWTAYLGDCVEVVKQFKDESIDYSVFSPPFADLYCYSDKVRDMGNSKNHDDFFEHFKYLIEQLYRVIKPGRLVSVHCMDLTLVKQRVGYIGLVDFSGEIIRSFINKNWIYHSKHTIWKDPLIAAVRTKALGLMHKQLQKDSSMCRAGLADYLITFRKPGENVDPVKHKNGLEFFIGQNEPIQKGIEYSHNVWRKYASPIWMDINQTRTLQKTSAREDKDEKHVCPLQLDVIGRALELWSNPGDLVLSPFMGIGSEGYESILRGRRFVGIELKQSYYDQAVKNLHAADTNALQGDMFVKSTI